MAEFNEFVDVDINDVDPDLKPVPEEFYTLRLAYARLKSWSSDKGSGKMINLMFAIVGGVHNGRAVFETEFPGSPFNRHCAKLLQVTGHPFDGSQPLLEWLADLAGLEPAATFQGRVFVKASTNAAYPDDENKIDWKSLQAA